MNPEDAYFNGNYAIFLHEISKDYDQAEIYYKKALELDPKDAHFNGAYAVFLDDIHKDYNQAETYYKKALELDSENANVNGTYANHLFITNKTEKAEEYWEKAFNLANKENEKPLLLELYFYHYAHSKDSQIQQNAKQEIKKLLKEGISSPGWNLDANIEKAEKDKHPEIETVKELAKKISAEDEVGK